MRILLTEENIQKLYASRNVLIPKEINSQMDSIADGIIKHINFTPKIKIFINSIQYDKKIVLKVFIDNDKKIDRPIISIYDKNKKEIIFFPNKIKEYYSHMNMKPIIISTISHEVIHYLDPKTNTNEYDFEKKSKETEKYYSEFDLSTFMNLHFNVPAEFDAYSKEFTITIQDKLSEQPNLKQYVLQWLKSNNPNSPNFITDLTLIEFYKRITLKNHRRLKLRIWNDIKDIYELV